MGFHHPTLHVPKPTAGGALVGEEPRSPGTHWGGPLRVQVPAVWGVGYHPPGCRRTGPVGATPPGPWEPAAPAESRFSGQGDPRAGGGGVSRPGVGRSRFPRPGARGSCGFCGRGGVWNAESQNPSSTPTRGEKHNAASPGGKAVPQFPTAQRPCVGSWPRELFFGEGRRGNLLPLRRGVAKHGWEPPRGPSPPRNPPGSGWSRRPWERFWQERRHPALHTFYCK